MCLVSLKNIKTCLGISLFVGEETKSGLWKWSSRKGHQSAGALALFLVSDNICHQKSGGKYTIYSNHSKI